MADEAGAKDKKIQATISAELKDQVRDLVKTKGFESEAEFLRTAVADYIMRQTEVPATTASLPDNASTPAGTSDEAHHDLKERVDLVAWLLTVGLVLISNLGSKMLRAVGEKDTEPMHLLNESLQTAVQERAALRQKLGFGWRAFNRAAHSETNGVHKH